MGRENSKYIYVYCCPTEIRLAFFRKRAGRETAYTPYIMEYGIYTLLQVGYESGSGAKSTGSGTPKITGSGRIRILTTLYSNECS